MPPELKPIEPKSVRWEPTPNPNDIVIPGLDTTAPVNDQIEQIEQLITIKLQNIDANFSKIQQAMANRILPAVKRYAVGTQPVREAAKFWTTFYEQAAQIRIPTYDDYGAPSEQQDETERSTSETAPSEPSRQSDTESEASTPHANRTFNPDGTSSEVSFAPQAALSSTPAMSRTRMQDARSFASEGSEPTPTWTTSLETPLMQLNRDIQSLSENHSHLPPTSALHGSAAYDDSQDVTQRPVLHEGQSHEHPSGSRNKGKGREGDEPLLQNILRRNANTSTATATSSVQSRMTSPLRFKPKTPVLKTLNPYLPPDTDPSDWKGVVDLADPASATPRRTPGLPSSSIKLSGFKFTSTANANAIALARAKTKTPPPPQGGDESSDEDFGMSPPVMTDYARLPKLGRTPKKEAAERITKDLLDVERRGVFAASSAAAKRTGAAGQSRGGVESSMSTIPTPPSMSRYFRPQAAQPSTSETSGSMADASLDSIMRRVGLSVPGHSKDPAPVPQPPHGPVFSSLSSASSIPSFRSAASSAHVQQPPPPEPVQTPEPPRYDDFYEDDVIGQGGGVDPDSSDSLDYEEANNSANPSAAFLLAAQRPSFDDDDSFDSSMGDDDPTDGSSGVAPIHPFLAGAQEGDDMDGFEDDSFDDVGYGPDGEEETLFGVPPAQRLQQQAQQEAQFRMLGEDLLQDTIGIGTQMAQAGRVEESPTPWVPANGR
ncbi:hypothetical protein PYCCODRAFT_1398695 [Trametes coccinea BRFM310]|uniref:DASH complex subunit ASK1 n=1 Tax=Trametes coccinea (strain BRFM310) TaxID=1353009 RepID=A0A1Y2I8P1_TRAC3|nr:hypothetical protein PYCCODRAFT_1398695 [Trametes coccinea BRFM310]